MCVRARHPGQRRTERIPRSYWLAVLGSAVVPVCASRARTVKSFVLETKTLFVSFNNYYLYFQLGEFLDQNTLSRNRDGVRRRPRVVWSVAEAQTARKAAVRA